MPTNLQKIIEILPSEFKIKKEKFNKLKNDTIFYLFKEILKFLGVFVRLYKRDGKSNYLKYLPYTWSLIERRLKNPIFKNFNRLLKKYLNIATLKKINHL